MKKRSTTYRLNKVDYSIFIIFSLAAAAMLFLFYRDLNSFTIKQSEEPVAKIYFKKNTAQRKFIDNDIWEVLTNSSDIYDGDRIRTSKDSEAYTEFNDTGIQIQLREKSMVQIFKNKKQRSVDFIGGEIFVANKSPEEKLVIHSGKKEIAVTKASEVKIALPEVSEAVVTGEEEAKTEECTVVVEVVSGKVEITAISEEKPKSEKNEKVEKTEPEPIVVSAGETITLVPEVEKPAPLPPVETPVVEEPLVEEETVEVEEEPLVEEEPAKEVQVTEPVKVDEPVKVEEPVKAAEPVKAPEPVKPAAKVEVAEEKPVIPPEPVEQGIEHLLTRTATMLKKSVYDPVNKKYNYSTGFQLSEIAGNNKTIPAGSVIEFSLSGTTNKNLNNFAIQISTGEEEWAQAHPFVKTYPNNGTGMLADIPFNAKTTIMLDKDVVNSDNSWVNICYEPQTLDEPVIIRELLAKVRVLSTNAVIVPVRSGYSKTLEYRDLVMFKEQWGQKADEYHYKLALSMEDILNVGGGVWAVSIPKGSTVKITVDGLCDSDIDWCHPEIVDTSNNGYKSILQTDNDSYKNRFNLNGSVKKNKRFNYSREYTAESALTNSLGGEFHFIMDKQNLKENPILKDLTITVEIE